jgi:spermidine synthase
MHLTRMLHHRMLRLSDWELDRCSVIRLRVSVGPFTKSIPRLSAAAYTDIVVGDARLKLQNAPDQLYGLIVLDAFNSDAIPVHLLTQEAIDLYMSKLATGGMLAFHISNRSLRLDGVLADLAEHNGAMSLSFADGEFDPVRGKDPSEWLVMARNSPAFDSLAQDPRWRVVQGRIDADVWTDDFSNILRVFRWY